MRVCLKHLPVCIYLLVCYNTTHDPLILSKSLLDFGIKWHCFGLFRPKTGRYSLIAPKLPRACYNTTHACDRPHTVLNLGPYAESNTHASICAHVCSITESVCASIIPTHVRSLPSRCAHDGSIESIKECTSLLVHTWGSLDSRVSFIRGHKA